MPTVILTLDEDKQRQGKAFTVLHSDSVLAAGVSNIVITPTNPSTIHSVDVISNSATLLWQAFGGITHTPGSGSAVTPIQRNFRATQKAPALIEIDPTIGATGSPFFATAIELIGLAGAGNRDLLEADLITSTFSLQDNVSYLIQLTNNTAATLKYEFTLGLYLDD